MDVPKAQSGRSEGALVENIRGRGCYLVGKLL